MSRALLAPVFVLVACGSEPVARDSALSADGADGTEPADTGTYETCDVDVPSINGCVVSEWVDPDADGYYPDVSQVQYDGLGRVVSTDERSGLDATEFTICGYEWRGERWLEREWCVGQAVYSYLWSFDSDDNPEGKVYDAGSDGELDKSWRFVTDAEGRIVEEHQDQDLDGVVDSTTSYTYDVDGLLVEERWDYDADGAADYIRTYIYDSARRMQEQRVDDDGNGSVDRRTTYTWAPDGRPLLQEEDGDGDGQADATVSWHYEDCVLNRVESIDESGVRSISQYQWTPDGRVDRIREDFNNDGDSDSVRWFRYACPDATTR